MMGESLSVKSNQLAYLVPVSCITTKEYASNPCAFAGSQVPELMIDDTTVLWTLDGVEKKLSDYIGSGKGSIKTLYKPLGDNLTVVYVFMQFDSRTAANTYFKDCFAAEPDKVKQYLSFYLNSLSDKSDTASLSAAGNFFYTDDKNTPDTADDALTLQGAATDIYSTGLNTRFTSQTSPFGTYVNMAALNALSAGTQLKFTDSENHVVLTRS